MTKTLKLSHLRVFNFLSAWRKEKAINKYLNEFTKDELVNILRRFYVEARSHDGKYYSRNSMKVIRAGLDRYLSKENKNFSIILDRDFKPANEVLNAHLVELAREGKISSTKHKPAMVARDVEILYEKKQLGLETPESLLQTAWFNIMLHFGKRGRENMRKMTADDIQLHKSSSGLEFITLVERATKNHQGGLNSNENENAAVMSEMPGNPRCPVLAMKTYLSKRNPQCQALWQKPKDHKAMKFRYEDDVWYCNAPLGKHKLENLLSEMSKKAGLATIYTSHCLRATSVTILKASGLENARVKSVTGHKSDSAVESYHQRPTLEQQVESSAIVSGFVAGSTQCQVGRESAMMEIQQNQPAGSFSTEGSSFTSSQVASTSNVSNVEHSVMQSGQLFSAGQFHNCIFNVKY